MEGKHIMEKYSIKLVDAIFKDYNRTIKYSGFGYNLEMTKTGSGYGTVPKTNGINYKEPKMTIKIESVDQVYGCKITVTDDGRTRIVPPAEFCVNEIGKIQRSIEMAGKFCFELEFRWNELCNEVNNRTMESFMNDKIRLTESHFDAFCESGDRASFKYEGYGYEMQITYRHEKYTILARTISDFQNTVSIQWSESGKPEIILPEKTTEPERVIQAMKNAEKLCEEFDRRRDELYAEMNAFIEEERKIVNRIK